MQAIRFASNKAITPLYRRLYSTHPPLCKLGETEQMVRENVYNFAKNAVAPKVKEMDEVAKMDPDIIKEFVAWNTIHLNINNIYFATDVLIKVYWA